MSNETISLLTYLDYLTVDKHIAAKFLKAKFVAEQKEVLRAAALMRKRRRWQKLQLIFLAGYLILTGIGILNSHLQPSNDTGYSLLITIWITAPVGTSRELKRLFFSQVTNPFKRASR